MLFFRILQHLLPRAEAWRIVVAKTLRSFFLGLAGVGSDARAFVDAVFGDIWPTSTRALSEWEEQFGLTTATDEATRRLNIIGSWRAAGGQSPKYIQDVLQAAGFPVFVHEWFAGSPADLGAIFSWWRGDDPGAVFDAGLDYVSIPDRGTVGTQLYRIPVTGVPSILENGRRAPNPAGVGGFDVANGPTSHAWLHQPGTNGTISFIFRSPANGTGYRLFQTCDTTNPVTGVNLQKLSDNRLSLLVGNGTSSWALTLTGSVGSFLAGTYVIDIRKTGNLFEIFVDGSVVLSGTATGLASGSGSGPVHWGGRWTNAVNGPIFEGTIFQRALNSAELAWVRTYLLRWTSLKNWVARDPRKYTTVPLVGTNRCRSTFATRARKTAQGIYPVRCNAFLANDPVNYLVNKDRTQRAPPAVPSNPSKWPFFFYLGGRTFPQRAVIDVARREEFERLVLKMRPLHTWPVLLVDYVQPVQDGIVINSSGEIQTDNQGNILVWR